MADSKKNREAAAVALRKGAAALRAVLDGLPAEGGSDAIGGARSTLSVCLKMLGAETATVDEQAEGTSA